MKFTEKQLEEILQVIDERLRSTNLKAGTQKITQALPTNTNNKKSIVDLYEDKAIWVQDVIGQLNSATSGATKQNAIKRITNKWTRENGNYIGCKFWTEEALDLYRKLGSPKSKKGLSEHFIHEHAMPQNVFIQIFTKPQTEFAVMALLYNGLNGVVVTKDEDKLLNEKYRSTMPKSFFHPADEWEKELAWLNPWARYIEVGVNRIFLCQWENDELIDEVYHEIRRDFRIAPETNL